jgi:CheY-like chemotaxis protein/two-component sensor histidine kinase
MDVARINQGKVELRKQAVDLATIVSQAVETARPLIDERRHHLSVSLPDEPIRLEGDPTRLEQILWNLLNNAAKYTDPGGAIRLTVEPGGGEVAIRVRDTGIGIEPAMLPVVFEMFAQVDHRSARAQGGLGIGLGLVKTLVEMHGGTITAASDGPGAGSEFTVRLPVLSSVSPEQSRPETDPCRVTEAALPRRRILVVDDNADAAKSLARMLSRLHGQDVRVAHDGPEALALAEAFRPEVVILDIGLPGMDGHEVARRLRERPESGGTLLVALTGWGQEQDRQRSRESGFHLHLVKPVEPDAIRLLVEHPAPSASRGGPG